MGEIHLNQVELMLMVILFFHSPLFISYLAPRVIKTFSKVTQIN